MSYSNHEVAHRFATGIGEQCHGSNMYFNGNIIYSYGSHFKIAVKWNGYLLFTERGYSNSTARHKSIVCSACSHYDIVDCAYLDAWNSFFNEPDRQFYDKNFKEWKYMVDEQVDLMGRARNPEKYLGEILRIVGRVERFCKVFGIEAPEEFLRFKDADGAERARKEAAERAKEESRRKREREKRMLEEFLNFESDWYDSEYQIVRYRADKNRFETSKRVQVPYETGLEFYRKLRDGLLKRLDKVLFYTVTEVGDTVRIGCHKFRKAWLMEYGRKMFNE